MGKKSKGTAIVNGTVDTEAIYNAHTEIKTLVSTYKNVKANVSTITNTIKDNWVGKGRNEFQAQYNLLIKKVDDFGDTLVDIYDALVDAESQYEESDLNIYNEFERAMEE